MLQGLNGMGGAYLHQSKLDDALACYQKALWYYRKSSRKYHDVIASLYGNMGTLYFFKADYELAAAYFDRSLRANKQIQDKENIKANTMINLGAVYLRLKQPQTALRYLEQGEAICREKQYLPFLIRILSNKGEAYLLLGREDSGMACFREQLHIAESTRDRIGLITGYSSLGDMLLRQGKPREALACLEKSERLLTPDNPYEISLQVRKQLGFTYLQLKDYTHAEQQLKIALRHAENLTIKDELPEIYQTLVQLYKTTGRYREALYHQQQLTQLNASIFNKEKIKEINELEVRYRTAEKDKQLLQERASLREKEAKLREQNFRMAGIVLVALLIIALLILLYRNARHRQKAALKEEETKQLQAMIEGEEKERSRISRELHDGIGGMLASVKMNLSAVNTAYPDFEGGTRLQHITQMLGEITAEVRRTAHNLIPDVLTKYSLEKALRIYCDDINTTNRLQVTAQCHGIEGRLNKATELMCYRMVQELVQNIIKHAHATIASVEVMLVDDTLGIIVEDNGHGFNPAEERTTGIGLDNLRFRVKALQGTMEITSEAGTGTTVYILFGINQLEQE